MCPFCLPKETGEICYVKVDETKPICNKPKCKGHSEERPVPQADKGRDSQADRAREREDWVRQCCPLKVVGEHLTTLGSRRRLPRMGRWKLRQPWKKSNVSNLRRTMRPGWKGKRVVDPEEENILWKDRQDHLAGGQVT
jgi:hypothetical protein